MFAAMLLVIVGGGGVGRAGREERASERAGREKGRRGIKIRKLPAQRNG